MTGAPETRALWIFGAGSHGREVAWLAREAMPGVDVSFVVDDPQYATGPVDGTAVIVLPEAAPAVGTRFITAIGEPALRRRAVAALTALGLESLPLVHPSAVVAPTAEIGPGSIVAAGSVVTDRVRIGSHAIVNIGCTLSHDVRVGDFATISPGVHVAGHVVIEDGAALGVGAIVINGTAQRPIVIGEDAVVGAGAVVIGDVAAGTTVAGVPARPIGSVGHP